MNPAKNYKAALRSLVTFSDIDTLRSSLARDINALGNDTTVIITLNATTYLNNYK